MIEIVKNLPYSEEVWEEISIEDKIMLFNTFPVDQIPKMVPIRIEKLNDAKRKMYEKKIVYIPSWKAVNWKGIHKFLVLTDDGLYLVRIYES